MNEACLCRHGVQRTTCIFCIDQPPDNLYTYPNGWIRLWIREAKKLKAWGGKLTLASVEVRLNCDFTSHGIAWMSQRRYGRIFVSANDDWSDTLSTLFHELAHIACGPHSRHGPAWKKIFMAAIEELCGFVPWDIDEASEVLDATARVAFDNLFGDRGSAWPFDDFNRIVKIW